ncbi:MAG: S8 family peptidase, partial [Blastocatellia bacterium]|nr:S8 family peptidase [Blastocatellia bacterium]
MKKFVAGLFAVAIVALLWAFVPMQTSSGQERTTKFERAERPISDSYIVVLDEWAAGARGEESRSDEVAEELAIVYQGRVDRVYKHAINGFSIKMNAKQAEALSRDPRVKFIEEDGVMTTQQTTQTNATWGLDRIDQRDRPLNGTYIYNNNGAGVRAFIIDTGILASHSQFGNRVMAGYTAINDGQGTNDCDGHGTHVAGTVGGSVHGVAKGVTLVPVRVLNCNGSGTTTGVIAGVDYVTAQKNANSTVPMVANMSLGGGASSSLDNAVAGSIAAGVTYAVAAGNDNRNACNYSPARVASALTVGATTSSDARASYSNFGSCVNIFAPGSSITSAWYTSNTATASLSGTSMASP